MAIRSQYSLDCKVRSLPFSFQELMTLTLKPSKKNEVQG